MDIQKVYEIIERETGKKVDRFTPLESLPIDSLEFLDLLLIIGQECGKEIPDDKISFLTTVGDLAEIVS